MEVVIKVLLIYNCIYEITKLNCWFLYYTKAANIRDDNSSILGLEGISLSEIILFYIALLADVISLKASDTLDNSYGGSDN